MQSLWQCGRWPLVWGQTQGPGPFCTQRGLCALCALDDALALPFSGTISGQSCDRGVSSSAPLPDLPGRASDGKSQKKYAKAHGRRCPSTIKESTINKELEYVMTNRNYLLVGLFAVAVVAFLGASSARATILAQDDFNSYTAGLALTGGAGGTGWGANIWSAPSAASTLATVNNYLGDNKVDMSQTAVATTIVASRLPGTPITQTFYASFVVSYFGTGVNLFDANDTFGLILSDLTTPSTSVAANVLNFGLRVDRPMHSASGQGPRLAAAPRAERSRPARTIFWLPS